MTKEQRRKFLKECNQLCDRIRGQRGDPEGCHGAYDDLMKFIVRKLEPAILKKADKAAEDIPFWYA